MEDAHYKKVNLNEELYWPVSRLADTLGTKISVSEVSRVLRCARDVLRSMPGDRAVEILGYWLIDTDTEDSSNF